MRCEDNINFYLSLYKFRKNDCRSDISHSLSFSKIFLNPYKPEFTIKIVITQGNLVHSAIYFLSKLTAHEM